MDLRPGESAAIAALRREHFAPSDAAEIVSIAGPIIAAAVGETIALLLEAARESNEHYELCSLTEAAEIARESGSSWI